MMELLAVIAIIAIVAAVAFPAFFSLQTNLEQSRLNASAKQVYAAAQNRLTALQSNGQLGTVEASIESTQKLSAEPADYPGGNWSDCSVYYLRKADGTTTKYLITSADSITSNLSGKFIIELSPSTGEIYSVFYWESGDDYSYSDVIGKVGNRSADALKNAKIGYYGGNELQNQIDRDKTYTIDDLQPTIINSNELYIKLALPDSEQGNVFGKVYQDGKLDQLAITVNVTGVHGWWPQEATRTLTYAGNSLGINAETSEVDIILDSMRDGLSFYDIVDGGGSSSDSTWIYPGSDISVSVTISYGGDKEYDLGSVNSLFESADSTMGTLSIGNLRHLNNLRIGKMREIMNGFSSYSDLALTDDIDFDASKWNNTSVSIQSRENGAMGGKAVNPLASFVPLDASGFVGGMFFQAGNYVDGQGHSLNDFVVSQGANGATGVFGKVGGNFKNIMVVNPVVTGGANTGALVGLLTNGDVDHCGVYCSDGEHAAVCSVTGTTSVGGLIGSNTTGSHGLRDSFAAIDVHGTTAVGGFVGTTGGPVTSNCYSSGTVTASGSVAGGFGGSLVAAANNCYSTSNVYCDAQAGAFAGYFGGAGGTYDYGYGRISRTDGTVDDAFTASTFGFEGADSAFTQPTNCYYLQMNSYNEAVTASNYTALSYGDLSQSAISAENSHPYSPSLAGRQFPFADTTGLGAHYGDWPWAVTATWYKGNGDFIASETVISGSIPVYRGSLLSASYFTGEGDLCLLVSWNDPVVSGNGDIAITGVNIAQPSESLISDTTRETITINGISCKSIWQYFDSKSTTKHADTGKAQDNFTCDSEAPLVNGLANATSWVTSQEVADGYDADNISFLISVAKGASFTNPTEGTFMIYTGEKLPAYPGTVLSSYRVLQYDVGRAKSGLAAYRTGTVSPVIRSVKVNNKTYSYYAYGTDFDADSDWF